MKKILAIICILLICFCELSVGMDIKKNNNQIKEISTETDYWAVLVCTNTTNITSIYNSIIETENWNESHIILLKREQATKENILDALDWLSENSDSSDIVLFSFTGHGIYKGSFHNRIYGISP